LQAAPYIPIFEVPLAEQKPEKIAMTPSKAILIGSGIIALSIIAAALVLPDRGFLRDRNTAFVTDASQTETARPRFQIIKTEHNRTWRLDTKTGEITVCHLQDDRMVCADSTLATKLPKATPEQLEAERKEQRQAKRAERNEMLDRFMSFFERIIKFAQKHAGDNKAPPEDDDSFKRL
jgi:hypothetical protein